MSGIVGLLNVTGAPVDRELLEEMTGALAFRGPDARDLWLDGPVGLGHTLLRTTPESLGEHQPFSLDGQVWITADARVDGRADLIGALQTGGAEPLQDAPDVELILRAYHRWDTECVAHLLGDFAFAIWDGRKRRLFCARDQLGVKPFFYAWSDRSIVISNTLNCVRLHPEVSDALDETAVGDYLLFGTNEDPAGTIFAAVRRLPGGHALTCSEDGLRAWRYWTLPTDGAIEYRRAGDYIERFRALLRVAVADRLRTDRAAVSMSGGLDSSTVAAAAQHVAAVAGGALDLRAFCIVYDRLIPDEERYYSGLVARALGISISYVVADDFPLFADREHPRLRVPDPVHTEPQSTLWDTLEARMAAHSRVLLTGFDGDTFLREPPGPYLWALLRAGRLGRLAGAVSWYVRTKGALPRLGLRTRLRRLAGTYPVPSEYPPWLAESFEQQARLRDRWRAVNAEPPASHPTHPRASSTLELALWCRTLEGYDAGVTRQACDTRHPFLDVRLVTFLLGIPPVPWLIGKHILRESMRDALPIEVVRRPKAPLAGDPALALLRQGRSPAPDRFAPSRGLLRFVDTGKIPPVSDWADTDTHLRPLGLGRWLQNGFELARPVTGARQHDRPVPEGARPGARSGVASRAQADQASQSAEKGTR